MGDARRTWIHEGALRPDKAGLMHVADGIRRGLVFEVPLSAAAGRRSESYLEDDRSGKQGKQ